eukprot:s939_g20.t1
MFRGGALPPPSQVHHLSVWSINVGGYCGLWKLLTLLECLIDEKPDVIAIQEIHCNDDQWKLVDKKLDKLGYRGFRAAKARRQNRGAAIAVRSCYGSALQLNKSWDKGQVIAVSIGNTLVLSSYCTPGEEFTSQHAVFLHDWFLQLDWKGQWIWAGDWNEEFDSSWIGTVALMLQGFPVDMPSVSATRWQGRKIIDFFLSNVSCGDADVREERISDHKIISTSVDMNVHVMPENRQSRLRTFEKPRWLSWEEWERLFQCAFDDGEMEQWESARDFLFSQIDWKSEFDTAEEGSLHFSQLLVDFSWHFTMVKLSWCFREAFLMALFSLPREFSTLQEIFRVQFLANHLVIKDKSPRFRTRVFSKDCSNFSLRMRKTLNRSRRLRELAKKLFSGHAEQDIRALKNKLFGSCHYEISCEECIRLAQLAEETLSKDIKTAGELRLTGWKTRMKNDFQARSAWINQKIAPCPAVGNETHRSTTKALAAEMLFDHWQQLGQEVSWSDDAESTAAADLLVDRLQRHFQDIHCDEGRPNLFQFRHALAKVKGCPGLDGWSKKELRVMLNCEGAMSCIWDSMRCWETQGVTPTCLQHCQVSCFGKQKKELHGCLAAESFRPVSVLSIFWRAWSATWIKSNWVDSWRSQLFPANMAGGYPKAWGPELMAAVTDAALWKFGYAVSLDFKHAFDCVNVQLLEDTLMRLLPAASTKWCKLLCFQWKNMKRWFHYAGHAHHVPLVSSIGLPQGDPASPLKLLIILRVGYDLVNEGLGVDNVFQSIYVDDRTVVSNSRERVQQAATIWRQFASMMHLKENETKTQFVDIHGPSSDGFKPWLEHLGACIGNPSRLDFTAFQKHEANRDKALSTLRKINILPLSVRMKMKDAAVFAKSRLSYGWIHDVPDFEWCKKYNSHAWKAAGHFRYGISELKAILFGAHFSIDAAILWQMFRLKVRKDDALRQIHAQFGEAPLDRCFRTQLTHLGWFFRDGKWKHEVWQRGFEEQHITSDEWWPCIYHFLRESWRKMHYDNIHSSHRHEFRETEGVIPPYSSDRIKLVKEWCNQGGFTLKLAIGSFQSPNVRARGQNGKSVRCFKCQTADVNWEHLWQCCMGVALPEDLFLRRFVWPRDVSDLEMCDRFVQIARQFADDINAD